MSGHSKWSTIKRAKAIQDQKKGNLFTKLARNLSLAAKNGKDPEMNPNLRQAIDTARGANMPKDNMEKAILRGAGELPGQQIEEITYEAYAPGGVALIIEVVTDNKNRTLAEIKSSLNKYNGKLAGANAVAYMFQKKGVIRIEKADEEAQLKAIDAGADDVVEEEGGLTIYTNPQDLEKIKNKLKGQNTVLSIPYSDIEMVPETKVELEENTKATLDKLLTELEENEDVNNLYNNAQL